jgi:hypothetical protein
VLLGAISLASCSTSSQPAGDDQSDPGGKADDGDGSGDGSGNGSGSGSGDATGAPPIVGPGATAHITFKSTMEKGGFWELGTGDIYTAFQTSSQSQNNGTYELTFQYGFVEPSDTSEHDVTAGASAGSCIDQGDNHQCLGGLSDADEQTGRSVVMSDDHILMTSAYSRPGGQGPALTAIDPSGATPSHSLVELTAPMTFSSDSATRYNRIARLPSGELLFSGSVQSQTGDHSTVLDETGAVLAEVDGYAFGARASGEILVLQLDAQRHRSYVWWNRETGATKPAGTVPAATFQDTPIYDHPVIRTDGGVTMWLASENRIVAFDPNGALTLDDKKTQYDTIYGVTPTGAVIVYHTMMVGNDWDWTLTLQNTDGTQKELTSKLALQTDPGWYFPPGSFSYPSLDKITEPLIDDAGNFYMSVIEENNSSYNTTYVMGFTAHGDKLFGKELDESGWAECEPHSLLPSGRLSVYCRGRVTNTLYLLGD